MKKVIYSIIFSIFFCIGNNSFAADVVAAKKEEEVNYKTINKELATMQSDLLKNNKPIKTTNDYITRLNEIENIIVEANKQAETDLDFVQKRIEALGNVPEDGVKEEYTIAQKRKEFAKEETAIKAKIVEGDLISAKINEIERLILNIRNRALLDVILDRQTSVVSPKNFPANTNKFIHFIYDIIKSPKEWYNQLKDETKNEVKDNALNVISTIVLSLIIATSLSIFIRKYFGYKNIDGTPDYSKKFFAAVSVLIAYGVIPATVIGAFIFWVRHSNIINDGLFFLVINKFLLYSLYIFISGAIVRVVFVPKNSKWRLFSVCDAKARSLNFVLSLSIFLIAIIHFFETISIKAEYPTDLILYIKFISCAVKTLCIVLIAGPLFKQISDTECHENLENSKTENTIDSQATLTTAENNKTTQTKISENTAEPAQNNTEQTNDEDYGELTIFDKIKLLVYLFAIIVFVISLFGFINLSNFILNHSILTVLIIGFAYIISNTVQVLFHKLLLLKFWTRVLKIKRRNLWKLDIWFGLIINPIILTFTIFILLGLWGVSTDLLIQNIRRFLTGFTVGGVKISITSILLGILVYFISMAVFKFIKIRFLSNTLEKMDIDYSARSSLSSGFSFVGFVISIFLAIAVMGGSVNNLAIIAGALSFGVGLGLQNIVSNFVSGVIILFERPIKIGDVVNINGQEGTVKQINIRATELETGTKSSIIIPNANIMSNILVNMTHNNTQTRIDLRFLVDINNDPRAVMKILLDRAQSNKKILSKPQPFIAFNDFSNNTLDFTLSCYIADIANKQGIINDLRVDIFNKFNENNIKMALPQRIIYVENSKSDFEVKNEK